MVVAAPTRVFYQPDESDISGEAYAEIDADLIAVAVEVDGDAAAVIDADLFAAVVVIGEDAAIAGDGDVFVLPVPAADAEIVVTADGETVFDRFISAAAVLDIAAPFSVIVDYVFAVAVLPVQSVGSTVVPVAGDAVVALTDDGATSEYEEWVVGANRPEFGFRFPAQFTDLSNAKLGDAQVQVDGLGAINAVAGVAGAQIVVERQGLIEILGLIQPLPFAFPLVFGIAEGLSARANIRLDPQVLCAVAVEGSAAANIVDDSDVFREGYFPWVFPIVL